jgi:hypothetical protein
MPKYLITIIGLCLVLTGCGLFPTSLNEQRHLVLMPPDSGPEPGLLKQKLTLIARERQQQFIVLSDINASVFSVLVMLPTGQALLRMDYDGTAFRQSNMTEFDIPARQIMAIMQFALWPDNTLKEYYQLDNGWQLTIDAQYRQLTVANRPWLAMQSLTDAIVIQNFKDHYQVKIEALETVPF